MTPEPKETPMTTPGMCVLCGGAIGSEEIEVHESRKVCLLALIDQKAALTKRLVSVTRQRDRYLEALRVRRAADLLANTIRCLPRTEPTHNNNGHTSARTGIQGSAQPNVGDNDDLNAR